MSSETSARATATWLRPLALLTGACVIAGALARFWGLGTWPLAIDEYYFARSVENVLHFGVPQFPCGGWYIRGLLLQYASALLEWAGLSAELAPRLLAAVCSLLTLPAVYQIGRRLGGREVGLLAVAVLGLSVWEIEVGRLGRMYAPFQMVFTWYLVFFLRYAVDGDRRALAPMILLSAVGVAVWEGGVFLVIVNLLPPLIARPDGRLSRGDWFYLAACSLLMIPGYVLGMTDLRSAGGEPALPPDYVEPPDAPSLSRLDAGVMPWTTLTGHLPWMVVAIAPAALVLYAAAQELRNRLRAQPLAALTLLSVLACAALQQFQVAAALLLVGVLLGVVEGRSLVSASSRPLRIALLSCVLFWTAFGLGTDSWHSPDLSFAHRAFLLAYEFVRFPDTVRDVAIPWALAVPALSLGLLLLIGASYVHACVRLADTPHQERVLLALFLILLLAASAVNLGHHETRYVFFLYPLAILFSILTLVRSAHAVLGNTRIAFGTGLLACIGAFICSEDFRPSHLWNINTEAVNFRIGMGPRLAGHYHPRSDVRAAADWLRDHVRPGEDIVVDSFPGVDFYYRNTDYFFVADTDGRFDGWSCSRGTVQRWSNLPMIHSYGALALKVVSGRRVWMVLESDSIPQVLSRFPRSDWTVEWTSRARDITIVSIHGIGKTQPAGS